MRSRKEKERRSEGRVLRDNGVLPFLREECSAASAKLVNHCQHKVLFFPLLLPGCSRNSGKRIRGEEGGRDEGGTCREHSAASISSVNQIWKKTAPYYI